MDIDGVTPLGGADAIVNKSAEDVLRRLPVSVLLDLLVDNWHGSVLSHWLIVT